MIEEDDSEAINDKIVKQKSEQVSLLKEHKIPEERQEVCIYSGTEFKFTISFGQYIYSNKILWYLIL